MDSYDAFRDYEHRVGRWWMLTGFALLLAVPTAICIRYDAWPLLTWVLKGLLGGWIGYWIAGEMGARIGGAFAVAGHNWPMFAKFKGGKAVSYTHLRPGWRFHRAKARCRPRRCFPAGKCYSA